MSENVQQGESLRAARDAAVAFARANVAACAAEIRGLRATGVLVDGKVRELARLCRAFAGPDALTVAERLVVDAAIAAVAG